MVKITCVDENTRAKKVGIQENDIEIIKNAVSNNSPEIMSWLREFIKNVDKNSLSALCLLIKFLHTPEYAAISLKVM